MIFYKTALLGIEFHKLYQVIKSIMEHPKQQFIFNEDLIRRYDKAGPRYTSYPTAVVFNEQFNEAAYKRLVAKSNQESQLATEPKPLSLYFHIPFCNTVCFYCGCNKVVTKNRQRAEPYLHNLYREIELQANLVDENRPVNQLHFGGGTPTFISKREMRELMEEIGNHFLLKDDDSGEYSIELDPREVDEAAIAELRELKFNRISLGVQDFDPVVQKAVNRIQSEEETLAVFKAAKNHGFKSISVDLIYGLPFQTEETFTETVKKIIEMSPDRVSVFNYAHLPTLFKPQRRINEADLPSSSTKLNILRNTMEQLVNGGYVYIGMDHFAKPNDELALAQNNGMLYRNFQGYSTHADCDLIAMGITSISKVGNSYSQNVKTLDEYHELTHRGHIPIFRGIELTEDDCLRREVINQLICHFTLDKKVIEDAFSIEFNRYFQEELDDLVIMEKDGLVSLEDHLIAVTPAGKLLIRNICMVFDYHLRTSRKGNFSKVI